MRRSLFTIFFSLAFMAIARPAAAQDPPASDGVGVIGVAYACPSADVEPNLETCDTIEGVTIQVEVDGVAIAGSPFVTAPNSIGFNAIEFDVPEDAALRLTQLSGIPDGYVAAPGSNPLVATVPELPIGGTGGESTSPYAFLVNVPAEEVTGASLTTTVVNCPPTGPDAPIDYTACVEPAAGIDFAVGAPNSGNFEFVATNANGVFSVSLDPYTGAPAENPLLVGEVLASSPYGEIVGYDARCSDDETGADVPLEYEVGEVAPGGTTYNIFLDVTDGDQISCTWFNTYQVDSGESAVTPVPEPVDPQPIEPEPIEPDPDALQVTIRGGDCDESGDVVTELTGAQTPDGDVVGQDDAVLVQTSVSRAQVSLDDLLAGDHVIDVRAPGDDDPNVLACGEIGGVVDGNGDLTVGLREIDDSGFSGIAYLASNDQDAALTGISVFVAEGLSSDTEDGNDD